MYEVTISINGIIHTISVPATDAAQINTIITNMYGNSNYQIINFIRKGWRYEKIYF